MAKLGRWVAKLGRMGGLVREMGGKVDSPLACYDSSLGSNPDISQKDKMAEISKGVGNTL